MSNLEQQIEDFGAEALRIADERNEYKRRADAAEARVKVLEEAMSVLERCDPRFPAWGAIQAGVADAALVACRVMFRAALTSPGRT